VDDYALFAAAPSQSPDRTMARLNRVSLSVHKCCVLPHRPLSRALLSFFGEVVIPMEKQVMYLAIKLAEPIKDTNPWSLSIHLADIDNSIKKRSHVSNHLRCQRFKLACNILRTSSQGWICGMIRCSLPILGSTPDEKLKVRFRTGLRSLTGLPRYTINSILYAR